MKLLIVEDESLLREDMSGYLTERGFDCETAADYREGYRRITESKYDIIVLDITLPGGTGIDLLRKLRTSSLSTAVLILSAKDSLPDKMKGFGLGADDYLTKPFYMEELTARLNAILRRRVTPVRQVTRFDGLEIDVDARSVSFQQKPITLTKKEFELLLFFIDNAGRVVSKRAIVEHLWGDEFGGSDSMDTIYVHTMNLRKKLIAHTGTDYIKTVYGTGYKWSNQ
ncbi:MAG: response regulator transcription factor [Bacteroidetes bacterium]|nr:response regulator transcription factor [Bacteroidota bacterium]